MTRKNDRNICQVEKIALFLSLCLFVSVPPFSLFCYFKNFPNRISFYDVDDKLGDGDEGRGRKSIYSFSSTQTRSDDSLRMLSVIMWVRNARAREKKVSKLSSALLARCSRSFEQTIAALRRELKKNQGSQWTSTVTYRERLLAFFLK